MTLEDYARVYARRCAARTVFKHLRPLLAYRVTNAANSNCRAPLPSLGAAAGADVPSPSAPNFFADVPPFHRASYAD